MKRIFCVLACFVVVLCLSSCGGGKITTPGVYNGVSLSLDGNDFQSVFGSEDWVVSDALSTPTCVSFTNESYGDVILMLSPPDADVANPVALTKADIVESGFIGYSIDVSHASYYPNMTWNGVGFGATASELLKNCGPADVVDEDPISEDGPAWTAYTYDLDGGWHLSFMVDTDGGIRIVSLFDW